MELNLKQKKEITVTSKYLKGFKNDLLGKQVRVVKLAFSIILFMSLTLGATNTFAQINFASTNITIEDRVKKIVSGDFDNDGIVDLIVANRYSTYLNFFKGNQNGIFNTKIKFSTGILNPNTYIGSIVVADFNKDGNLDLIFNSLGGGTGSNKIIRLLGTGTGSFYARTEYPMQDYSKDNLSVSDFNSDGIPDLVYFNIGAQVPNAPQFSNVNVLLGNINGTFNPALVYNFQNSYAEIGLVDAIEVVGDYNADGKKDIALVINYNNLPQGYKTSLCFLFGNGAGSFNNKTFFNLKNTEPEPHVTTGDFNKDGIDDIAINGFSEITTFISNRISGFVVSNIGNNDYSETILCEDFNNDGDLDILVSKTNGCTSILTGIGKGIFNNNTSNNDGVDSKNAEAFLSADFNKDGKKDLAFGSVENIKILLNRNGESKISSAIVTNPSAGGGRKLTITGFSLSDIKYVFFDGISTPVIPALTSDAQLVVSVPDGAFSGPVNLQTTCNSILIPYVNVEVKKEVIVTVTTTTTKVYGQSSPVFIGNIIGLEGTDMATVTYPNTTSFTPGIYTIYPVITGIDTLKYKVIVPPVTLIIAKAPVTITAMGSLTKVYGGATPAFATQITGLVGSDNLTVDYSTMATNVSGPGIYPVTATVSGPALGNYILNIISSPLIITPAPLAVTATGSLTKIYGNANPVFTSTITGLVGSDNLIVNYTTPATDFSPPGTYPVTATVIGPALGNYVLNIISPPLVISPAILKVTVTDIRTKIYGTANPLFTSSVMGLIGTDKLNISYSTTATQFSGIGDYPVTTLLTGAALNNYTSTVFSPPLIITKSNLTVTPTGSRTKIYGTANPVFKSSVVGLVGTDSLTINYNTTATNFSWVGVYPVNTLVTGTAIGNYTLTIVNPSLTVTPASLTLSSFNYSKVYGTNNPAYNGSITRGLVGADVVGVDFVTNTANLTDVGNYPIVAVLKGPIAINYEALPIANAQLTIAPARLDISLDKDYTREYGLTNPKFIGSLMGLVANDLINVIFNTPIDSLSVEGIYPMTPAIEGLKVYNYIPVFNHTSLTLTITPRKYEAEFGILSGSASVANTISGYSAEGYVTNMQDNGNGVGFNITVNHSGAYKIKLGYSNNAGPSYQVSVYVNGKRVDVAILENQLSPKRWSEVEMSLELLRGNNVVEFQKDFDNSSGKYNLDYIKVPSRPKNSIIASNVFEAENATLGGNLVVSKINTGYSSTGYVTQFNTNGNSASFKVDAAVTGNYKVLLHYSNGAGPTYQNSVYLNGVKVTTALLLSNGSWTQWQDLTLNLVLVAGINTISFQKDAGDNTGDYQIDYIAVPISPELTDYLSSKQDGILFTDKYIDQSINIYPNPACSSFTIDLPLELIETATISVINLGGKLVKILTTKNKNNIVDTSNWSAGIYIVQVQSGKTVTIKQIVINR